MHPRWMPSSPNPPFTPTRTWRQRSCPHRRRTRVKQGHGYAFADDSSTSCLRKSPASTRRSRHVPPTAGEPKSSSSTETGAGDSFRFAETDQASRPVRCRAANQLDMTSWDAAGVNPKASTGLFQKSRHSAVGQDAPTCLTLGAVRHLVGLERHHPQRVTARGRTRFASATVNLESIPQLRLRETSLSFALQLERPGQDVAHRRQQFTALIRAQ